MKLLRHGPKGHEKPGLLDAQGQPQIDPNRLTDPRWARPYSGLYWQLDAMGDDDQLRRGVLRSRSLWDAELRLEADALANGALHMLDLLVVERVAVNLLDLHRRRKGGAGRRVTGV